MSVLRKLQEARIKLQNTQLKKSGHNKFAGYCYFELGDFLPTIQTIFAELHLCGVVTFGPEVATLTIYDTESPVSATHSAMTSIAFTSPMGSAALKGCHEVQNIGAVETYQRRYLYVSAMEIVEHDALEATTGKEAPAAGKPVTRSVFDSLDAPTQEGLRDIAMEAMVFINRGDAASAVDYIKEQSLDADMQTALWSLFDSKSRSAMKAVTTTKKAA